MAISVESNLDLSWATHAYCDGGVAGKNPSPYGGSWAVKFVSGNSISRDCDSLMISGHVTPAEVSLPEITNNVTELLAAMIALECLPPGWAGELWTDSQVTLSRLQRPDRPKMNGLTSKLAERLRKAVARQPYVKVRLLAGHPTRADLWRGTKLNGTPVSIHNSDCDMECRAKVEELMARISPV